MPKNFSTQNLLRYVLPGALFLVTLGLILLLAGDYGHGTWLPPDRKGSNLALDSLISVRSLDFTKSSDFVSAAILLLSLSVLVGFWVYQVHFWTYRATYWFDFATVDAAAAVLRHLRGQDLERLRRMFDARLDTNEYVRRLGKRKLIKSVLRGLSFRKLDREWIANEYVILGPSEFREQSQSTHQEFFERYKLAFDRLERRTIRRIYGFNCSENADALDTLLRLLPADRASGLVETADTRNDMLQSLGASRVALIGGALGAAAWLSFVELTTSTPLNIRWATVGVMCVAWLMSLIVIQNVRGKTRKAYINSLGLGIRYLLQDETVTENFFTDVSEDDPAQFPSPKASRSREHARIPHRVLLVPNVDATGPAATLAMHLNQPGNIVLYAADRVNARESATTQRRTWVRIRKRVVALNHEVVLCRVSTWGSDAICVEWESSGDRGRFEGAIPVVAEHLNLMLAVN